MDGDQACDVHVIEEDLGRVSAGWLVYRPSPPEAEAGEVVVVVDPQCSVDVDAVLSQLSECLPASSSIRRV